jgi:hypothetical protein
VRNTGARPFIEMVKPRLEMELARLPPAGPSPRPASGHQIPTILVTAYADDQVRAAL